jgi:hypothetical protein
MTTAATTTTVCYLGTHQFALGGALACTWTAVYNVMQLLYAGTISVRALVEQTKRACEDWGRYHRVLREAEIAAPEMEYVTTPVEVNSVCSSLLEIIADFPGLNVPLTMSRDELPEKMRLPHRPGDTPMDLAFGFPEAVSRVLRFFHDQKNWDTARHSWHSRRMGVVLTHRGGTLCFAIRAQPEGPARFDLVDTHQRRLRDSPIQPGLRGGEAVWFSTYKALDLSDLLSEFFPPSANLDELTAKRELTAAAPSCVFSVSIIRPRYGSTPRTRDELEQWESSRY